MIIERMISHSFCWAIMKKTTKKWDLETSNEEMELKIGIYVKNWARQAFSKNFNLDQRWRSKSTSADSNRANVAMRQWMMRGQVEHVRRVKAHEIRQCRVKACGCVLWQAKTWGSTWRCVGAPLGLFLARFWSKKSDLSHRNYGSTIWLMNRLDLRGSGWVWQQWLASNDGYRWRRGQWKNAKKYH